MYRLLMITLMLSCAIGSSIETRSLKTNDATITKELVRYRIVNKEVEVILDLAMQAVQSCPDKKIKKCTNWCVEITHNEENQVVITIDLCPDLPICIYNNYGFVDYKGNRFVLCGLKLKDMFCPTKEKEVVVFSDDIYEIDYPGFGYTIINGRFKSLYAAPCGY